MLALLQASELVAADDLPPPAVPLDAPVSTLGPEAVDAAHLLPTALRSRGAPLGTPVLSSALPPRFVLAGGGSADGRPASESLRYGSTDGNEPEPAQASAACLMKPFTTLSG